MVVGYGERFTLMIEFGVSCRFLFGLATDPICCWLRGKLTRELDVVGVKLTVICSLLAAFTLAAY